MKAIVALVSGRCALIFNVLFGISFYLILRKPSYSSMKFAWRCFLLMLIGVINKYFYGGDILMIYGFCGILLTVVRNFPKKWIITFAFFLYIAFFVTRYFDLSVFHNTDVLKRHGENISFRECHELYLPSLWIYVKGLLSPANLIILANFCIGYWMGRIGLIEKWDSFFQKKHLLYSIIIYLLISAAYLPFYREAGLLHEVIGCAFNLAGGAFYTIVVIWSYNHLNIAHKVLSWFESYGKCGLTNYSMQNWFSAILLYYFGLAFKGYSFVAIILCAILFFILQNVFCRWWLSRFNNGPMEYLWRCATERRLLQFRKA